MLSVDGGGGAIAADAALRRRRGEMNWDAGMLMSACYCLMWRVAARRGLASQDVGDGWPPRGGEVLKWPATVASIQLSHLHLTVHIQRVETTKPLIISKNHQYKSCSPVYQLQLLLKDQDLILQES